MLRPSGAALRGIVLVVALLLGLSAAPPTFAAQGATDQLPDGLVDGAYVTYTNEDDFSSISLSVFAFEDAESAETTGLDAIVEATSFSLNDGAPPADDSTPVADLDAMESTGIDGLEELGDEAVAYEIPFGEGVSLTNLLVRDGANVHLLSYVAIDLGSLEESGTTPEVTDDAVVPIDVLAGIAGPWFEDGIDRDAELIDQIPTVDLLPDGYTETDRQESLELDA